MNTRHLPRLAALILLGSLHAGSAFACSIPRDGRSIQQRVDQSPLAFIGTVQSVDDSRVQFRIEVAIRGATVNTYSAALIPPTICGRDFSAGQRWLFAGTSWADPSFLIQPAKQTPPATKPKETLPNAWLSCSAHSDCSIVRYGCDGSQAVSNSSLPEAKKALHAAFGNPAALNCQAPDGAPELYRSPALCIQNICSQTIIQP